MSEIPKYDLKDPHGEVCNLCECDPKVHVCFWKCPIFDNEKICSQCCIVETLRENIAKKMSEKLGREITKEEINAKCQDCGRNHACQNEALANEIETGTKKE